MFDSMCAVVSLSPWSAKTLSSDFFKGKEPSPAGNRDWSNDLFQTCAVVDFYVTQAPAGPAPAASGR